MTPRQLVTKAIEIIADPAHWTQGVTARDADGMKVDTSSDDAVSFCALGAIYRASGNYDSKDGFAAVEAASTALYVWVSKHGFAHIGAFNDGSSHADVLEALAEVRESLA